MVCKKALEGREISFPLLHLSQGGRCSGPNQNSSQELWGHTWFRRHRSPTKRLCLLIFPDKSERHLETVARIRGEREEALGREVHRLTSGNLTACLERNAKLILRTGGVYFNKIVDGR